MAKFRRRDRVENHAPEEKTEETTSVVEEPSTVEPPTGAEADAEAPATPDESAPPINNFVAVGDAVEAAGGEVAPPVEPVTTQKRGVIPDQFGNNVKGQRICAECGVKESDMLAKNPRYSFCRGVCVNCYGKKFRKATKPADLTIDQIKEKIAYYQGLLDQKTSGAQGSPDGTAISNVNEASSDSSIESHGAPSEHADASEELATVSEN